MITGISSVATGSVKSESVLHSILPKLKPSMLSPSYKIPFITTPGLMSNLISLATNFAVMSKAFEIVVVNVVPVTPSVTFAPSIYQPSNS